MIYLCVGLSKILLLAYKGGVSFVDLFCKLCFVSFMLSCLSIAAFWPPAGKRAGLLALFMSCLLVFSHFPMCCPGSGLVLDCINS